MVSGGALPHHGMRLSLEQERWRLRFAFLLLVMATTIRAQPANAQFVQAVRPYETEGTVKAIREGVVAITDKTGKSWQMRFSTRKDGRVSLGRNKFFAARRPTVDVSGALQIDQADRGFKVRFSSEIDDEGRVTEPVTELSWVDDARFKAGVKVDRRNKSENGTTPCVVSGRIEDINARRVVLAVPRSRHSPKGRLTAPLGKDAKLIVKSRDLSKVQEQDRVTKVSGLELNTGDFVIQDIAVRLVESRDDKKNQKKSEQPEELAGKYQKLSTESVAPRAVRSQHFVVHTDISDRAARVLLDKLEEMIGFVSRYYGRPQPGVVECYVVEDIKQWPPTLFSEEIKAKIASKEGVTHSVTATSSLGGRKSKSTVYAVSIPGVVQHEAVHAYCNLTFGSTGPTWYSEGMAEMGQYWKESQHEVDVDPKVIRYIRKAKTPKTLKEIVKPNQITGDSWEAYAWRWALCHMLVHNPNYNRKFKELGIGLMSKRPGVSFTAAYGKVAKQLMFEYDQFVEHVDIGYRADLCAWRWKHRFKDLRGKGHEMFSVKAKAGWQPTLRVEKDVEYEYSAKGEWKLDGTGLKTDADGDEKQGGRLTAVVMTDYQLGEPVPLGVKGKLKAPESGDLYLRCGEKWTKLGDNSGTIKAYFRLAR